jgi:hemoglobin
VSDVTGHDIAGGAPGEVTVHELVGGTDAFVELVDRFYERVEQDAPLRAVYPEDLEPGKRHLALFLAQYWGGPRTYSEERGHPMLRRRHFPFAVSPDGAARWATHMLAAIRSMDFPEPAEAAMVDYVVRFTPSMVNTPDEP